MRSKFAKVFVITMMFTLIGTLTACGGGSGKQDAPKEITKEDALAYADKLKEEDWYAEDWNGGNDLYCTGSIAKEKGVKGVVAEYKAKIEAADPSEYKSIMDDLDKTIDGEDFGRTKAEMVEGYIDALYAGGEQVGASKEDIDKVVEKYRSDLEAATTNEDAMNIHGKMSEEVAKTLF